MSAIEEDPTVELTKEKFEDLDLDPRAKKVLKDKGYVYLTNVQSRVLPLALQGKNLVIQSPTGSGKTLCFLLPAVKLLFEEGYSANLPVDANLLGCICLAPTRELATQTAIQMKDLATPLKLNAGCCIGGIRDKYDKKNAARLHILTGTPGRILALLSSQALPDTANVKLLVLDEADRLLDSGFRDSMVEIVSFLPSGIQILLFSATIKSSLKELCDMILRDVDHEFVCLGPDVSVIRESKLRQEFMCLPQSLKFPALFSILSKNQNKRIIVFLATCKHVRFVFEVFKRLIPAVPMTELHGKQSQSKRMSQFTRFAARQNFGCIFTTDVAARGIDFPSVDIVIQMDLPESTNTYIHRVGRAGRLAVDGTRNFGRTISMLGNHELSFVTKLRSLGINMHDQTNLMKPLASKKEQFVLKKLQAILAKESWIKDMAQRAVIAYLRYLNTRKSVPLTGEELVSEVQDLALATGLPNAPLIQVEESNGEISSKRKRKLAKLKERIKKKKMVSGEDSTLKELPCVDEDVQEDVNEGDSTEFEDVLFKGAENAEADLRRFAEMKASRTDDEHVINSSLAISRKRLRLNRRGIAKIRGILTLKEGENRHMKFEDEESDDGDQFSNKFEEPNVIDTDRIDAEKTEYVQEIITRLQETAQHDREREAERISQKRSKRRSAR